MRRGVSTLYYGLFHRLSSAGATPFRGGGLPPVAQVMRVFSHTRMRKVCDAYANSPKHPIQLPFDDLVAGPPDLRLAQVANALNRFQEARHRADHETATRFDRSEAPVLLEMAEFAHRKPEELTGLPQTAVFLTALLLADPRTRRG